MYEFKIHLFHACIEPSTEFCIQFINSIMCCLGIRKKCIVYFTSHARMAMTFCLSLRVFMFQCKVSRWAIVLCCFNACNWPSTECCVQYLNSVMSCHGNLTNFASSIC